MLQEDPIYNSNKKNKRRKNKLYKCAKSEWNKTFDGHKSRQITGNAHPVVRHIELIQNGPETKCKELKL